VHIETARLLLRPWEAQDQEPLARLADDRRVSAWLRDRFPAPYTRADAAAWLARAADQGTPTRAFAITRQGVLVGGVGLDPLTDVYQGAYELGYWLGADHWGQGYASEAVGAVVPYAFATVGARRLQACVFAGNPASVRVLEKCGFRLEGRLRQAVVKRGRVLDALLYGLLPGEAPSISR